MELTILFASFAVLLVLGVPVAFCLGLSSLATLAFMDIPLTVAFQRMSAGMNLFALMAIPFFVYAGDLMNQSGIAERLLRFADGLLGRVRGGLGQVNVAANLMFGGISGSAVASASALGSTLIPMMRRQGYHADYAVNVTVTSAITALLIPPSHNLIIYSIAAGGVSVSALFLAGVGPGVLVGALLMTAAYFVARKRGYPAGRFPGWRAVWIALLGAAPGLLSALIIVGGILSGVFTATESSAIAVAYTLLIAIFVHRSLPAPAFAAASRAAVRTTAMVMLIIGCAAAFGWVLALTEAPSRLAAAMLTVSDNPIVILLLINLLLLVLGTFMDMSPLIVITTPIFLPVAIEIGVDPVQFGVMMILNLGIGLVTPPVGSVLFVGCAIGGIRIADAMKSIWPFYAALALALALTTYLPAMTLTLPRWLGQ